VVSTKLKQAKAMKPFESLSEAMNELKSQGYTSDFNLHPEWIECIPLNIRIGPAQFHVDAVYRFEGMNNPDDSSVLYAISTGQGVKGVLVDAYGVYSSSLSSEMIKRLKIDSKTSH
jgi:hypothetical protein